MTTTGTGTADRLESHLRARRDTGRPLLVPYLTGGVTAGWTAHLSAFAAAGADAVEVGLPFSDPTLDGPTVRTASEAALARGVTAATILAELADLTGGPARAGRLGVPVVVSTYANLALRDGFCAGLAAAGVAGLIVPDAPLEHCGELAARAGAAGVELALLASPSTPEARLGEVARRSRGFVYAVSVQGTTGERDELAGSAPPLATRLRRITDRPVLLGFGISTPAQAALAARYADGVIVGAAVTRRVLAGAGPAATGAFVAALRTAVDATDRTGVD
jgi:tryptophan synthase alpha chain